MKRFLRWFSSAGTALSFRYAIMLVIGTILFGAIGLVLIEDYGWIDAIYMSIITISTVGFTEVEPLSPGGKVFISILIVVNLGVVAYALAAFSYYVIEGNLFHKLFLEQMQDRIDRMEGHTIICGYGKYGKEIASHFQQHEQEFVLIDESEEKLKDLLENKPDGLYVVGDATDDEVLRAAGIDRARALITALNDDSDNLFIVLSAKELNPALRIVSRSKTARSRRKMIKAGASHVIMPEQIGGFYMATLISKPGAVEFFSFITNELASDIGFEEIRYDQLPRGMRDKSIKKMGLRAQTGVNIIGHRMDGGRYNVNPAPDSTLAPGESFIAVGSYEQIQALRKVLI
jgi:voltage-gated potassium channel